MKKYVLLLFVILISLRCNGQKNETEKRKENTITATPKGSWKVNKEFDKNGNLIQYDSIYSWSSNEKFKDFSSLENDSIIKFLTSRYFSSFSEFKNKDFEDIITKDSLFSKRLFNNHFLESSIGNEYHKIRQEMLARQREFLEKYHKKYQPKRKELEKKKQ